MQKYPGYDLEDAEVKDYERRQEVEIPSSHVIFTEHRSEIKECPIVGKSTAVLFQTT